MPDPTMDPIQVSIRDTDGNGMADSAVIIASRNSRPITFTGSLNEEIPMDQARNLQQAWLRNAAAPHATDDMTREEYAFSVNGGDMYDMALSGRGLNYAEKLQIAYGLEEQAYEITEKDNININASSISVRFGF